MTAKDFRTIAAIIATIHRPVDRHQTAILFANALGLMNPRFNRQRFMVACGVNSEPVPEVDLGSAR